MQRRDTWTQWGERRVGRTGRLGLTRKTGMHSVGSSTQHPAVMERVGWGWKGGPRAGGTHVHPQLTHLVIPHRTLRYKIFLKRDKERGVKPHLPKL